MEPFSRVASIITPLEKINVDTDQIVPKQFLKLIQRTGFGRYLFYNWRYGQDGKEADFVLNDPAYRDSKILVTGENFGCGSSREHAVWALMDYGFSVVIAPSFADIFLSNCFKNGVLPVQLDREAIRNLYTETGTVDVDLKRQVITTRLGRYTSRWNRTGSRYCWRGWTRLPGHSSWKTRYPVSSAPLLSHLYCDSPYGIGIPVYDRRDSTSIHSMSPMS